MTQLAQSAKTKSASRSSKRGNRLLLRGGIRLFVVEDDIETAGAAGLELQGSVQWCAEAERCYQVGIQFVGLTEPQTRALARALAAVTPS